MGRGMPRGGRTYDVNVSQLSCLPSCANCSPVTFAACGHCSLRYPDVTRHQLELSRARGLVRAILEPGFCQCEMLQHLAGQWVLFMGDSTHRHVYEGAWRVIGHRGFNLSVVRPHVDGIGVRDRDLQKDKDTVFEWLPNHRCRSVMRDPNATLSPLLLSFRFMRGLDLHKLDHVLANFRQRFHYPEWRQRSPKNPTLMLLSSDAFDAHPVTRRHFENRSAPAVIIFNACAWDLPHINKSEYYFGFSSPEHCHSPPAERAFVYLEELRNGTYLKGNRTVKVMGVPCVPDSNRLSDDAIYAGFEAKLRAAMLKLRASFKGRLVLRSCHAGTRDLRRYGLTVADRQLESLFRMDAIVRRVAAQMCIELLDVMALDAAAGWHEHNYSETFHVPQQAADAAGLAALRMLMAEPEDSTGGLAAAQAASAQRNAALCVSHELHNQIVDRRATWCRGALEQNPHKKCDPSGRAGTMALFTTSAPEKTETKRF